MVNPLILLSIALGFAFIFPVFEKIHLRVGKIFSIIIFIIMAVIPITWLISILTTDQDFIYTATAGLNGPLTINVAVSLLEAMVLTIINLLSLFILVQEVCQKENPWKGKQIILFTVLLLGANGLVITRDLFNIFVFMEISSISLFGLLSSSRDERIFEGGFKYMLATGLSSTFYLIGIGLFYLLAGTLNIDSIPPNINLSEGVLGSLWPVLILTGILIELKPALANGWAMDTYESADYSMGAIMSGVQATAFIAVVTKLFSLVNPGLLLPILSIVGAISFIISQLQALTQTSFKKMLAYSSSAQIGLVLLVLGSGINLVLALILLLSHSLGKSGLFFIGKYFAEESTGYGDSKVISGRNRPLLLLLSIVFILALLGLPPFPAFGVKWTVIQILSNSNQFLIMVIILVGSLLEGVYLFRWFGKKASHPDDEGTTTEEEVPSDDTPLRPVYDSKQLIGQAAQTKLAGLGGSMKVTFITGLFHPTQLILLVISLMIFVSGIFLNMSVGLTREFLLPFSIILIMGVFDIFKIPTKFQTFVALVATLYYGWTLIPNLSGLSVIFGFLFIGGIAVQIITFFNRKGYSPGLMSMVMGLLVSLGGLLVSSTNFQLFFAWEIMALTSYFLLTRGNKAGAGAFRYITFSLGSAFLILAGLSMLNGVFIGDVLTTEGLLLAKVLISLGALIKLGTIGFHIWLPTSYAEAENDISSLFSTVLSKVGLFLLFLGGTFFTQKLFGGIDLIYIIGWLGAITALAGSMMALFQEDIKYTLAYSSMGQVGYMILGFAVMSHLGWMSSFYLAITHLMFKGMLFLSVAGVIYRTGTRFMYQTGGLIRKMPFSFLSALFAIIALSGVPPLSGFGAKWLMYSALLEKGWYLQAAAAMFASGVAFLYLFRLIHSIFLGQEKAIYRDVKEAPLSLLIPQYIFMILIMVVSMFPNLLLKPLQNIIDPYFTSTIQWSGYEVISSLGYWNGNAVMYVTMGVFLVPLIWLMIVDGKVTKVKQFNIVYSAERPYKPETTHYAYNFFGHYQKALGFLVDPWAKRFWEVFKVVWENISGGFRRYNSGNAQGYAFQIVLYLIFIYLIWGGQA